MLQPLDCEAMADFPASSRAELPQAEIETKIDGTAKDRSRNSMSNKLV